MTERSGTAAVFTGANQAFELRQYPVVSPAEKDVLLELKRSGICGTDLHIHTGRLPMPEGEMIIGHEFCGEVVELGANVETDGVGQSLKVGDNAIACVAIPCGKCANCRKGETASCLSFGVTYCKNPADAPHFHGGYAEFLHSPAVNLVKIPEQLNLDAVAALPCAGPTLICAYDYAGGLNKGELVVVQGAGPLGLFATAWAVKAGCHVVVIGSSSNPDRQAIARDLGAEVVLDHRQTDDEQRQDIIMELAAKYGCGNGADVVVETSGNPKAVVEGMNLTRTRGRYIVPGQYSASGPVEIQPQLITFKALQIIGSGQYKLSHIKDYLDFIAENPDIETIFARCITHKYSLSEIEQAFANASTGQSIKGVFVK